MLNVQRHTRRVLFLRLVLPVCAAAGLVLVIAWPMVREYRAARDHLKNASITLNAEDVSLSMPGAGQQPQIAVTKPSFTGLSDGGQAFTVTADRIVQGVAMDTPMTLDKPAAAIALDKDGAQKATMNAQSGQYDPKKQSLVLRGDVTVTHSDGYHLLMRDFDVDLHSGMGKSTSPVTGSGPGASLSGQELELRDNGRHIILKGPSKITFDPDQKPDKK